VEHTACGYNNWAQKGPEWGVFLSDGLRALMNAVEQVLTIIPMSYLLSHWRIINIGWNTPTVHESICQMIIHKTQSQSKKSGSPLQEK